MTTIIIGTARSGTTAIYSVLQRVLAESNKSIDFLYEPFLWDVDSFNQLYTEISEKFSDSSSISSTGMFLHKKLPLFYNSSLWDDIYHDRSFDDVIRPSIHKSGSLSKYIRASGRLELLDAENPNSKFVYIIRNPLDCVNSLSDKFSFYGGEFHSSDRKRFINEVAEIFNVNLQETNLFYQSEVEFWYYMNLFALENISKMSNCHVLVYEDLVLQPRECMNDLFSFLGISYDPQYETLFKLTHGVKTTRRIISKDDLDIVLPFMSYYEKIVTPFRKIKVDYSQVIEKYTVTHDSSLEYSADYALSPVVLKNRNINLSAKNSTLQLEKMDKQKEIDILSNQLFNLNKSFEKILILNQEYQEDNSNLRKEKDAIQNQNNTLLNELEEYRKKQQDSIDEIRNLSVSFKNAMETLANKREEIETIEGILKEQKEINVELVSKLDANITENSRLSAHVIDQNIRIEKLCTKIINIESELKEHQEIEYKLNNGISNISSKIVTLKADLVGRDKEIIQVKKSLNHEKHILEQRIITIESSLTFKIGKGITYLPRKIFELFNNKKK